MDLLKFRTDVETILNATPEIRVEVGFNTIDVRVWWQYPHLDHTYALGFACTFENVELNVQRFLHDLRLVNGQ